MTNTCDTSHEDRPEDIKSFQNGSDLLARIREEGTRLSREKIIPIIKETIEFANTTEELQILLSWTTPGHCLDKLVLKKMIETAKTEEELGCLQKKTLLDAHPSLQNFWEQRKRKITMNRG